jgi:hypothetical protein
LIEGEGLGHVPILQNLQNAHDNIIAKRVHERSKAITSCYRRGTLTKGQAAKMLCMSKQAVYDLLSEEPC